MEYLLSRQHTHTAHSTRCPCLTPGTLPAFSCLQKAGNSTDSSKPREPVLQSPEQEHSRAGLLALAVQCLLTKKENPSRGKPAFPLSPITTTLGCCSSRPVETTRLLPATLETNGKDFDTLNMASALSGQSLILWTRFAQAAIHITPVTGSNWKISRVHS